MSIDPNSFVDYEWPIAECFELRGDEVLFLIEEGCEECLIQYIIQHKTRAIPMTYVQKNHPEIFETIENVDEQGCTLVLFGYIVCKVSIVLSKYILNRFV